MYLFIYENSQTQKESSKAKWWQLGKSKSWCFSYDSISSVQLLEKFACNIKRRTSAAQYAAGHQSCCREEVGGRDR